MLKNLNWHFLIMVVLASLLVFGGTAYYYKQKKVERVNAYLAAMPGIENWQLDKKGNHLVVAFKPMDAENWPALWREIDVELKDLWGEEHSLQILAEPNAKLYQALEDMKFPLYEGVERGNLVEMKKTIESLAMELGIDDMNLAVDEKNVYLVLKLGDRELYEVTERKCSRLPQSREVEGQW